MTVNSAVDVGAAVFNNTKGDYALALSLHPNVVRRLRDERDKLPLRDRMQALSLEKSELRHSRWSMSLMFIVESALDDCSDLRDELLQLHEGISRIPAIQLEELARSYAHWQGLCQEAMSRSGHLTVLPDGGDVDYDAAAIAFLLSLEATDQDDEADEERQDLDDDDPEEGSEAVEGGDTDEPLELQIDPDLQDPFETIDNRDALARCLKLISAPMTSYEDFTAAHKACIDLPEVASEITGYRPGETPIGGICGGCGQLLKAVVRPSKAVANYRSACIRHVKHCHARRSNESVTDILLATFPRELERNAFEAFGGKSGKTAATKLKNKPLPLLVHDVYVRTDSFFKNKKERVNPLRCDFCHEPLESMSLVVGHMLSHNIWLPGIYKGDRLQRLIDGEWDGDLLWLPEPTYSYWDERYHPDPRELERFSEEYFELRIIQCHHTDIPYGARDDMIFTASERTAIKASALNASDKKYVFIAGERGRVEQEGLDILQCHNPLLRWSERMRPFCGPPSEQCENQGTQLRLAFIQVIIYWRNQISMVGGKLPEFGPTSKPQLPRAVPASKFPLRRPFLLDHEEDLSCPDLNCRSARLKLSNLITLAWHLVGVHGYHLTTAPGSQSSVAKSMHDLCFTTEAELRSFLEQTSGRFIRNAKAERYLKRRARAIEGHHEKEMKAAEKKRKAKSGKGSGPSKKRTKRLAESEEEEPVMSDEETAAEEWNSDESDPWARLSCPHRS